MMLIIYNVDYINHIFLQVSIRGGLYVHFVEEWLKIFPRKQLHFIHYESYIKNRTEELKKTVSFIGIGKTAPIYQH